MGMGGVQRTLKFAKYLKEFNWQPVVLTDSPKKYFAVDNSLLNEAKVSGIIIERTGAKDFDPSKIIIKAPKENMRKLRSAVSQFFFIPDSKIGWRKKALKKVDEIWSKYGGFDLVFATAPPYTDFLIGQEIKKKYKIPLVIDYRDAWVDSPVLNYYPTPYHKLKNMRLEKGVLQIANKVITTNRRVKEYIISRYGNIEYNDVKIITHGFDSEDFEKASHTELPLTNKFRVSYSGSFYTRNPKFYFEAIKTFVERYPELRDKIEFCFIGTFSKENLQIAKNLGIEQYLNITGYLEHIDCVKYILASDVLFLMISRGDNEDAAMPGKVGEYIGSRKNIIACIPEGVTKKMLEKYNAIKFINEENPEQIARAIKEYYDEKQKGTMPEANIEMLSEYDRKNLTYELAKEFNLLKDID